MDRIDFNKYFFTSSHLRLKATLLLTLKRLWSINHFYVVKRGLMDLPAAQPARTPLVISKVGSSDARELIASLSLMDVNSKKEMISRLLFYRAGFKNCYIGRTKSGEMAYIQWLVYPSENPIIEKHVSKTFYTLNKDQVMIENAFAFPKFRGIGLMPQMTTWLLSKAKEEGYKSAIGYIRKDRIASLNEFIRLGFKLTKIITEYKVMGVVRRTL
jgi:hypothetical protein